MEPFTVVPLSHHEFRRKVQARHPSLKVYHRVLPVFLSSLTIVVALTLNPSNIAKAAEPFVGLVPDKNIGIMILTNEMNVQGPNSLGGMGVGSDSWQRETRLRGGKS
jgi:hypothetical protein